MTGSYNALLVVLSVAIASLASYAALDLSGRVAAGAGRIRRGWLVGGSLAMGIGIWSMHFTGMLAFRARHLGAAVPMTYDMPEMLLSVVVAVAASALALAVVSRLRVGMAAFVVAGLAMGAAICGMHYIGMASVRMPAAIGYRTPLVLASIAIAVAASLAALWLAFRLRDVGTQLRLRVGAAVVMGLAISGMHYTAMAAARFTPLPVAAVVRSGAVLATDGLAGAVVVGTTVILTLALLGTALDRRLKRQMQISAEHERLYRAAETAAARMAALQAVTAELSGALTRSEIAQVVVARGLAALGARAGSIALLTPDETMLEVVGAVGYSEEAMARFGRMPVDQRFPLCDVVRSREAVVLQSADDREAQYPHLAVLQRENGAGPMAAIPIGVQGRVSGALGINLPEGRTLEQEDVAFLTSLAHACSAALERARLYEAERRARAEAEAANRAKSDFLATMSHELRTPLNAIGGYVELLELGLRGPVTDAQRDDLARIRRNQHALLSVITDILTFARVDSGRMEYRFASIPLGDVLGELESLVAPQMRSKGLAYEYVSVPPDVMVWVDRERLEQVLLNLLSNAIKFTPSGGRITLRADHGADEVHVHVADTGRGIPADKLEAIFEPFVQVEPGLSRRHEGTGLGLAISRELARAMGGDITIESTPGEGSTFTLAVPARAPAEAAPGAVMTAV